MSQEVFTTAFGLWGGGTIAVGTTYAVVGRAPSDAQGGGITILNAGVCSRNAIAAGSAPLFTLVTCGTSSAPNGTIGTMAEEAFTAGTVKSFTITDGFVDASEFVAVKVAGTVLNAAQIFITGWYQYVMGK